MKITAMVIAIITMIKSQILIDEDFQSSRFCLFMECNIAIAANVYKGVMKVIVKMTLVPTMSYYLINVVSIRP